MIATRRTTRQEAEALRDLLSTRAMKTAPAGEFFTLASGRQSKLYLESKHVTLAPEAVLAVGNLFLDQADRWHAGAVGGLAAGSIPISTAVVACAASAGRTDVRSFYVRSERKDHGTREQVFQAFASGYSGSLLGPSTNVLLVDDVLTSGKSIGQAIEAVRERGATVAAVAVLVDRCEGGAAALRDRFRVPVVAIFRINDQWQLELHDDEVF